MLRSAKRQRTFCPGSLRQMTSQQEQGSRANLHVSPHLSYRYGLTFPSYSATETFFSCFEWFSLLQLYQVVHPSGSFQEHAQQILDAHWLAQLCPLFFPLFSGFLSPARNMLCLLTFGFTV